MKYQIVEKDTFATDWSLARYNENVLARFDTEEQAMKIAKEYITDRNCNNALTKDEKRANIEAYIMTESGCFLGVLDGKDWYLDYQKDFKNRKTNVTASKGDIVKDQSYFELEGKTEVKVRAVPGM